MPILYVNGRHRGLRIRGRAVVKNPTANPSRRRKARKGKMPPALARYWKAKRGGGRKRLRSNPSRQRRRRAAGKRPDIFRSSAERKAHARAMRARKSTSKRGRRARRSTSMAKKRARGRKRGPQSRRRAALLGIRRRKAKAGKAPKRRRSRKSKAGGTKRRRTRRSKSRKGTKRRSRRRGRKRGSKSYRRAARLGHRRRRNRKTVRMVPVHMAKTLKANPGRRRRRRRSRSRRRRTSRRRGRRSYRRYRRNPGNLIMDMVKQAVPVLAGIVLTGGLIGFVGPMIPGVSSLGSLQSPLLSVAALFGINFAAKHSSAVSKYKGALMTGAALNGLLGLVKAFAPASIKNMVGLSDYVAMSDYIAVGGAPPLNERFTLSDYIAVGGDGVEEELGLEEELGVEEELGNDLLGGMPGGASLLKQVPSQSFLQPVPARSFTKQIPAAGGAYDSSADIYTGIFNGKFGG